VAVGAAPGAGAGERRVEHGEEAFPGFSNRKNGNRNEPPLCSTCNNDDRLIPTRVSHLSNTKQ